MPDTTDTIAAPAQALEAAPPTTASTQPAGSSPSKGGGIMAAFDAFVEEAKAVPAKTPDDTAEEVAKEFDNKVGGKEEQKEEEAKEDPKGGPEDKFPTPEAMDVKSKARWGEIKKELRSEHDARVALENKISEMEKRGADTTVEDARLKEMEEQIAQYEQQLSVVKVEGTREFEQAVRRPLAAIYNVAEALSKKYSVDLPRLLAALEEHDEARQDERLNEVMDGFNDRDKTRVYAAADDVKVILSKRDAMLGDAKARAADLEAREKADAARVAMQERATRRDLVGKVVDAMGKKIPGLDAEVVAAVRAEAESSDFTDLDPRTQAFSVGSAAFLPRVVARNIALEKQLAEAQETIKRISAAGPSGDKPAAPTVDGQRKGFLDAVFSGG